MSDPKIRLGGLWKSKSKNGVDYLSGSLGQARLLIFRNDQKRDDSAPDYTMYIVPREKESSPDRSSPPARDFKNEASPPDRDFKNEEIPF